MTSWHWLLQYYGYNNYHTKTAVLHFYLELERRQKPFSHIFLKWFIICCMPWFENKKEHGMTIFTICILKKTGRIGASFWALSVFSSHIAILCRSAYPSLGLIKISQNKALECCRFGHKHIKMQPMLTFCLISFFRCGRKRS